MDTREKILPSSAVAGMFATGEWAVVVGLFDPMTAVQARRLAEYAANGRKVLAIVLTDPEAILEVDARAALVSALRSVSAVLVASSEDWKALVPVSDKVSVFEDETGERQRRQEFVNLVQSKLTPGSGAH